LKNEEDDEEKSTIKLAKAKKGLEDLDVVNKVCTRRVFKKVDQIFVNATFEEIQDYFVPLGVSHASIVANSKESISQCTSIRRLLDIVGFRFNPLCVNPDFAIFPEEGEGWVEFRNHTSELIGFRSDGSAASAAAVPPTATNEGPPLPPKSPSNLEDEDNASLAAYLVSNPPMCSAFTQASKDAGSDDPETREDAKNVIDMITKLAADRAASKKRKAASMSSGQEKHFSFDDESLSTPSTGLKADSPATGLKADSPATDEGRPFKKIKTSDDGETADTADVASAKTDTDVAASTSTGDNSLVTKD